MLTDISKIHDWANPGLFGAPIRHLVVAACLAICLGGGSNVLAAGGGGAPSSLDDEFNFYAEDVTIVPAREYDVVRYAGASQDAAASRAGFPQLPVLTFHFALPPETQIDELTFEIVAADTLEGEYLPLPIRDADGGRVLPDQRIYGAASAYPETMISVVADGHFQGHRLAALAVYPLQYIGRTKKLVLITELEVSASLAPLNSERAAQIHKRYRPDPRPLALRSEIQWMLRTVRNPEDLRIDRHGASEPQQAVAEDRPFGGFVPTERPSLEGPPVEYVIITDTLDIAGAPVGDLITEFQELADWKTLTGVPTVVKTVTWIAENYPGVDRAERIRNFVKDAAAKWGTRFVCLGGDFEVVPTRLASAPTERGAANRSDPPVDWYYGELDASWNSDGDAYWLEHDPLLGPDAELGLYEYLDVWIGRLPCRNPAEAATMVGKVMVYGRAPGSGSGPASAYYDDVLLVAGPTNSIYPAEDDVCGIAAAERLVDSLSTYWSSIDIQRLYPTIPDTLPLCSSTPERCYDDLWTFMDALPGWDDFTYATLRSELNDGHHIVYHAEHSLRDKLGSVTFLPEESANCADQSWLDACLGAFKAENSGAAAVDLSKDIVDDLTNGSANQAYSIVFSGGSYTNQWDLDSVSEHFMRAPNGGAVAYFGKTASRGAFGLGQAEREILEQLFAEDVASIGEAVGLAGNGHHQFGYGETLKGHLELSLLADPEMSVWSSAPGTITLTQTPTITIYGSQTITINVKEGTTPIDGARVCIKQGDASYAVAWSNSSGDAVFHAFVVDSDDDASIVATKRDFVPKEQALKFGSIASTKHVVYDSHIRDDFYTGDNDEILEPGETQEVRVIARNNGAGGSADGVVARLWPTAPIICDLRVDDVFDPDRIFIGEGNAHPTAAGQDTFRIPANWEAIRTEGEPSGTPISASMYFHFWRDTTAVYHIRTKTTGTTADSILTGILRTEGGFASVDSSDTEGPDEVVFSAGDPDVIEFEFHRNGASDEDELEFRAESVDWLTVSPTSVSLGDIAAGDTASGVFDIAFSGQVPDDETVVFTLAAEDDAYTWWFSDFSEWVHAPAVRLISQDDTYGGFSNEVLYLRPTVANLGSAGADSVVLTLHGTDGSVTVVDSVVTMGAVAAGDTVRADNQFHCTASSHSAVQGIRFDLEVETLHQNGDSTVWSRTGLDVLAPDGPTGLLTDEHGAAVILRWTPADSSDIEGYHVYQDSAGTFLRLTRAPIFGTTRYETTGLSDLAGSTHQEYSFAVTAVDSSGNESGRAYSDTARVWLEEETGWPRFIRSGSNAAVKLYDLDGDGDLEVIAAGKEIYAWHHDGTGVLEDDGLFWDPQQAGEDSIYAFVQSLAIGDLDANGHIDIVGNVRLDSLYAIEYNASTDVVSRRFGIQINSRVSPPIIANLDQSAGDTLEVLLMSDVDSRIHAWSEDGSAFNMGAAAFVANPLGADNQYNTVAVGDVVEDTTGLEIVQAVANPATGGSNRDHVYCWNAVSGRLLWDAVLPGQRSKVSTLSVPVIADVNDDDQPDVVVARGVVRAELTGAVIDEGGIFVLEWQSGTPITVDTLATSQSPDYEFTGNPLVAPGVGDLDGDDDLEIVMPGGSYVLTTLPPGTDILRTFVFDLASGGGLDAIVGEDHVPIPSRKFTSMWGVGSPVIADLDGDDAQEILIVTHGGFMGQSSWDSTSTTLDAARGWPMFIGEEPTTPAIGDLDQDGDLEVVVQDLGGEVHVFATGADSSNTRHWWQFGADAGNTFSYPGPYSQGGSGRPGHGIANADSGDEAEDSPFSGFTGSPQNPVANGDWIEFSVAEPSRVVLDVHDIRGRRVRNLVEADLLPGAQRVFWDGEDSTGRPVARGIYFFRLQIGDAIQNRKVVLLR